MHGSLGILVGWDGGGAGLGIVALPAAVRGVGGFDVGALALVFRFGAGGVGA